MTARRLTGLLLILAPLVFAAAFSALASTFDYPAILRQPAADVLARFSLGGSTLLTLWYALMLSALALAPAAIGFALINRREAPFAAGMSAGLGLLASLFQVLGLARWVFLVPWLAASYAQGGEADKGFATSLFDAANHFLGMGIGEHLGYMLTALWTVAIAVLIWKRLTWFAIVGVVLALGILAGLLEPLLPSVAVINAIAYSLWAVWMIVLGAFVLMGRASE